MFVEHRRKFLQQSLWSVLALWTAPLGVFAGSDATHVVKKGDTLNDIAKRYGTSVSALKARNGLRSDIIKVGQRLTVPGATASGIHVVAKGETLSQIAHQYGTSVSTIKRTNDLPSDLIVVGQQLAVPGAVPPGHSLLAPVIAATDRIRVDSSRWRYLVCHHSAIEAGNAAIYGRAHQRRGMEHGLAYHFVIGNGRDSGDGQIEIGPRWHRQLRGGHVRSTGVNDAGIGICLVGNLQHRPPTRRQRRALNELLIFLKDGYSRSNATVTVHKWVDKNHTVCPGRHFPYEDVRRFA